MWLPLYALILWLVWRHSGWRGMLIFTALMLAAIGLADMVSGIFKSNGVLGGLLPDFEPRPRPMFTPSLEGLDITPDSLRVMRREASPPPPGRSTSHPKPSAACTAPSRRTPRPSSRWPYCRLRRDPPPLVHGADGRLLGGDLLLAHLPRQTLPDGPRMGHAGRRRARIRRTAGLPPSDPPGFRRRLTHPGRQPSGRQVPDDASQCPRTIASAPDNSPERRIPNNTESRKKCGSFLFHTAPGSYFGRIY